MKPARAIVGVWLLTAILFVPVFPHFISPNEMSRWAVAAAIVESGTVEVSSLLPILGTRLEDLSEVDGRVYSNKAPGTLLVALPGYLAARVLSGPPSPDSIRPALYAMRLAGATLPLLLLAIVFARAARRCGASEEAVAFALFVLLFGTVLFAYGLLLFSHALVAACLFAAWTLLFAVPGCDREWKHYVAGALIGLAVLSEYPAAVPGAVLVAATLERRNPGRALRVILGGLPLAAILGLYNRAAFGGFFELSSGHERLGEFQELAGSGLFGIGLPSPVILLRLLLDPSKGLLIFSPVLLLAPAGWRAARAALGRRGFITLLAVPASVILLYAGYPNWHGGWTVGPRYLVAAIPFVAFPLALMWRGRVSHILAGYSAVAVVVTSVAFPFVPPPFPLPWGSFAFPMLRDGLIAPNIIHLLEPRLAALIPALLLAALPLFIFRRAKLALFAVGVGIAVILGFLAEANTNRSPGVRIQRGYVREVYLLDRGALQRSAGEGLPLPPRLLGRMEYELTLPPTIWPFR